MIGIFHSIMKAQTLTELIKLDFWENKIKVKPKCNVLFSYVTHF